MKSPEDFLSRRIVFDAVLMNFIVRGEMSRRLSDGVRNSVSTVDWVKISDFRNIIAHDYLGIDAAEVWQIISSDLPLLKTAVRSLLPPPSA